MIVFCMLITIENRLFVIAGDVLILTRERKPNAQVVKDARKVLDKNKISADFLVDTPQEDCHCQLGLLVNQWESYSLFDIRYFYEPLEEQYEAKAVRMIRNVYD